MSVVIAVASQALSIAADWAVNWKSESTKRLAGPSEPGRGSIGKTKAGLPTKLPRSESGAAAVVPSSAGLNPLPRLLVAVGLRVASLAPLP